MEIKLNKGEQANFKLVPVAEYNELVELAEKQRRMTERRREALKKYYDGLTTEEKQARAKKAVSARIKKNGK